MLALTTVLLELGALVAPNLNKSLIALAYVVAHITVRILDGHKEGVDANAQIARFIQVGLCNICSRGKQSINKEYCTKNLN